MKKRSYSCIKGCPVEATLDAIGGKWKGVVLYHLLDGTKRFGEFRRILPGITQRILTKQLRELEESRIVHRKIYAEVPPRVEYSLTEYGQTLKPILIALEKWGQKHAQDENSKLAIDKTKRA